jgi:hypothetical protein
MQVLPSNVNDNPEFDVVKYPRTTLKLATRCQSLEKQIYSVIKKIKRVYPGIRSFSKLLEKMPECPLKNR